MNDMLRKGNKKRAFEARFMFLANGLCSWRRVGFGDEEETPPRVVAFRSNAGLQYESACHPVGCVEYVFGGQRLPAGEVNE